MRSNEFIDLSANASKARKILDAPFCLRFSLALLPALESITSSFQTKLVWVIALFVVIFGTNTPSDISRLLDV